jgi:hypothetical protein
MDRLNEEAFNEIYKELLQESISHNQIINIIKNRKIAIIYYEGHAEDNVQVLAGYRYVEIFCYGKNKFGNDCVRAWARDLSVSRTKLGKAKDPLTKIPGWRMFRVSKIKTVKYVGDAREKDRHKRFTTLRPKYNPKDKDMQQIYMAVDPNTLQRG